MTNIIDLPVITTLDHEPDKILREATGKGLTDIVIMGWDKDGELYFASSTADGGEVLWLMEHAKKELMET